MKKNTHVKNREKPARNTKKQIRQGGCKNN
jgi:hypothetical protein